MAPHAPLGGMPAPRRFLDNSGAALQAAGLPAVTLPPASRDALVAAAMAIAGFGPGGGMPVHGMGGGSGDMLTRPGRRLYVGNLPPGIAEPDLLAFFTEAIAKSYKPDPGLVLSTTCKPERNFGFVEFASMELATAAMGLDGITFRGQMIKVQRPTDYNPDALPRPGAPVTLNLQALGIVSTQVPDGPNKVFVGGLPYEVTEAQLKSLLEAYGALRGLHLVKDAGAMQSKGYAFCEYQDASITDAAVAGLNDLEIAPGRTLTVRRANPRGAPAPAMGAPPAMGFPPRGMPPAYGSAPAAPAPPAGGPTQVLRIAHMMSPAELSNPTEVEDIRQEAHGACSQHGTVLSVVIPTAGQAAGVVFAKFASPDHAASASGALSGKTFDGRRLETSFVPAAQFDAGVYV